MEVTEELIRSVFVSIVLGEPLNINIWRTGIPGMGEHLQINKEINKHGFFHYTYLCGGFSASIHDHPLLNNPPDRICPVCQDIGQLVCDGMSIQHARQVWWQKWKKTLRKGRFQHV